MLIVISALEKSSIRPKSTVSDYSIGLVENLGMVLYKDYLVPMELSAVLFFVAMAGVVLLNRKERIISSH